MSFNGPDRGGNKIVPQSHKIPREREIKFTKKVKVYNFGSRRLVRKEMAYLNCGIRRAQSLY